MLKSNTSTCLECIDPPKKIKCACRVLRCLQSYCACHRLNKECSTECECHNCCNIGNLLRNLNNENCVALLARRVQQTPKDSEWIDRPKKIKCACKLSRCLHNYCACHRLNKKCSTDCKCQNCCNIENPLTNLNNENYVALFARDVRRSLKTAKLIPKKADDKSKQ